MIRATILSDRAAEGGTDMLQVFDGMICIIRLKAQQGTRYTLYLAEMNVLYKQASRGETRCMKPMPKDKRLTQPISSVCASCPVWRSS